MGSNKKIRGKNNLSGKTKNGRISRKKIVEKREYLLRLPKRYLSDAFRYAALSVHECEWLNRYSTFKAPEPFVNLYFI